MKPLMGRVPAQREASGRDPELSDRGSRVRVVNRSGVSDLRVQPRSLDYLDQPRPAKWRALR